MVQVHLQTQGNTVNNAVFSFWVINMFYVTKAILAQTILQCPRNKNHRTIELFRLEKTPDIESNH